MGDRIVRRRFRVHGVVQGVGYRYFTVTMAERLDLVGWVANAADGTVVTEAEGRPEALDAFLAALKAGPSSSQVRHVEIDARPVESDASFVVRREATA